MGRVAPGTSFPDLQMIYCALTRIPQMITSHRLVRALTHQQLIDNSPSECHRNDSTCFLSGLTSQELANNKLLSLFSVRG